jgi:hypothetical protein
VTKHVQKIVAFGFGVVFVISLLVLAVFFPAPTSFQYLVFRTVLSLAAAGIASMIPGFLEINISAWLRAGGALAVFAVVYFNNPAQLVATPQQVVSISPGQVSQVKVAAPIPKRDSAIQFVDYNITYARDASGLTLPVVDLKMRNTGDQAAFLKKVSFNVLDSATFEDCNNPQYDLIIASATYDIDLVKAPSKAISHVIKPSDVDRIKFRVGRSEGGPTLTVYKATLQIIYDEDDKTQTSKPFFLRIVGPAYPAGEFIPGTSKKAWDACVQKNIINFKRIGYKIYKDEPDCDECSGGS